MESWFLDVCLRDAEDGFLFWAHELGMRNIRDERMNTHTHIILKYIKYQTQKICDVTDVTSRNSAF